MWRSPVHTHTCLASCIGTDGTFDPTSLQPSRTTRSRPSLYSHHAPHQSSIIDPFVAHRTLYSSATAVALVAQDAPDHPSSQSHAPPAACESPCQHRPWPEQRFAAHASASWAAANTTGPAMLSTNEVKLAGPAWHRLVLCPSAEAPHKMTPVRPHLVAPRATSVWRSAALR